ncbi:thiol-disulfide oxidoreductase DCC family protein, partial [Streptomyces sp. NRRL S-146]|uniref:thiol-disulfide oxidoreductase DCC family protein n=1 Tax=Streptomyces sp. NRRL S-146 TaxID=1463884 RepID=UPI00069248C2
MRMRPVLIFDGDCGFCTTSVDVVQRLVRPRCEVVAWQHADLESLRVTEERARHEALWVTPTGRVYGGAQAVAKVLLSAGGLWSVPG